MLKPRKVKRCTVKNSGKNKNIHMQVYASIHTHKHELLFFLGTLVYIIS